jgi:hypothetical protein
MVEMLSSTESADPPLAQQNFGRAQNPIAAAIIGSF